MKELKIILNVLLLLLCCSCNHALEAQNLALNKPYTLYPLPNYPLSSSDKNHSVLTDGINSTSNPFWVSDRVVGWQNAQRITIDIDLNQISIIDRITFNTARGNGSDVQFPAHIFVFSSTDKVNYSYQGDAASDTSKSPGSNEIKKFALSGIQKKAEFIKLIIIPNGFYVFCDEIEVFKGTRESKNLTELIKPDSINNHLNSLLTISRYRGTFKKSNNAFATGVTENLTQVKTDRLHALQEQYKDEIIVDKVNPWVNIYSPYKPINSNDYHYNFNTIVKGNSYGAFVVTNLSNVTRSINCVVDNAKPSVDSFQLYTVPFVSSGKENQEIADPLVINDGPISLPPGESRMFLFKITGKFSGEAAATIKISSKTFLATLSINSSVLKNSFQNTHSINAINWAYLNNPLINDRKDEAVNDLLKHNINTMVVPPNALPLIGSSDFSSYESYISKLKSFKKLFLFINFSNKDNFKGTTFMSSLWKDNFIKWYNGILASSKLYGFDQSQIYLYPYDEIGSKEVDDFYNFLTWLKSSFPAIKTFGTIDNINSVKKIMPLLSITQIINNTKIIEELKNNQHNEVWLYDTKPNSESLSPYSYYRLISWQAFLYDIKGVGFWNYADINNPSNNKLSLSSFDGVNNINYSVIYNGSGSSIISSRRWEAFSEGIEDFELLKLYAQKMGIDKAKSLAESVINSPNDTNNADLVRNQILLSLNTSK